MNTRQARAADKDTVTEVLRRSIRELCVDDHNNNTTVLDQWLSNKTPENALIWITTQRVVVAESGGKSVGVAACTEDGEITLNYVVPEARFEGVSDALLRNLESHLRDGGLAHSRLTSTQTAHRFYLERGYSDTGPPQHWGDLVCYPMRKSL